MVKGKILEDNDFDEDTSSGMTTAQKTNELKLLREKMERIEAMDNPREIEDTDDLEEEPIESPAEEEDVGVEIKMGDYDNYTKEIDYGVIDEEGSRISCKTMAEAKILSLLLKLIGGK